MTLRAGFEYEVRLERLADRYYRLHSHTVFGGLYKRDGDQLVLQTPTRGADPQFRWTLDGDSSAKLTAEAEVFGARYVGATLTRVVRTPPRDSIDLGKHLLRVSTETANGEAPAGIFMVPDTRDVAAPDLFAQARSGKLKPGFVELIARTPGPRSASERLEVISFEEKDRKITATVKHVSVPDQQGADTAFHLRAKLAPLPPGKYDVEVRFEEWVKDGNEPRRARKPQFAPLTCSFTFPAPPKHEK